MTLIFIYFITFMYMYICKGVYMCTHTVVVHVMVRGQLERISFPSCFLFFFLISFARKSRQMTNHVRMRIPTRDIMD